MPEITQITLTHEELVNLIIKQNDVHEGKWSLLIGMGIGMGMFGPSPKEKFPGATVTVNQIGIQRVVAGATPPDPNSIIVDASVTNPAPKPKSTRNRKKS